MAFDNTIELYDDGRHPALVGLAAVAVPYVTYKLGEWLSSSEFAVIAWQNLLNLESIGCGLTLWQEFAGHGLGAWQEAIVIAAWIALFVRECIPYLGHTKGRNILHCAAFTLGMAVPVVALFITTRGIVTSLLAMDAFSAASGWQEAALTCVMVTIVGGSGAAIYAFLWRLSENDVLRLALFSALTVAAPVSAVIGPLMILVAIVLVGLVVEAVLCIFVLVVFLLLLAFSGSVYGNRYY